MRKIWQGSCPNDSGRAYIQETTKPNIPKCCATCRHCQRRTSYCHKREEKRFDILGDVKCEWWVKRWKVNSRN